ncbi:hypothetical protein BST95_08860 [Halioglobus japonicus]|uniref:DUF3348 domain-containing protein n=1 Tax=Halioglobus japonicus TaxID=930805 RepID=A0AAP8SNC9_9GAMM|nr:DUF3348 family protein [Halioglobus japonicus]AQA18325.1 hypothetical protein BST95_08860 [Halioglobus japonicus]PLW86341.1 DUF3348 domain-containing protein [Halioglobus japonicus]GHD13374.1 hypothetical protein GCM10007052_15470 [Halioglobus japonicus]
MTQALPQVSLGSSRLVRFLSDLAVTDTQVSHRQFTERLGQWIDFSDSITLSDAHARDLEIEDDAALADFSDGITQEFLRARSTLIQAAMRSFFPSSGPTRIKWPTQESEIPKDAEAAMAPYLKFYQSQQMDIETKIRGLHLRTREASSALSTKLARICAIDAALGDALAPRSRRFFAAIPALLQSRLEFLFGEYQVAVEAGSTPADAWANTREQYRRESQGLLLAEIEARLLPALGLIEALNEETPHED